MIEANDIEGGGRDRWVNVADLAPEALALTNFEPGEIVILKDVEFEVETVVLDPATVILVPVKRK
jgi:hypothetical protein